MTLKEQTIKRIEQQKEKIEEHKKEYGRVSLYDKLELKYLESVLKDLEVLEILKKNCFMKVWSSEEHNLEAGHYYLVIQESKVEDLEYMSLPITENDYQKIKEWLEDDR